MRRILLTMTSALLLGLCAYLSARMQDGPVKVRLRLVDSETGKNVGGLVRVIPSGAAKPLALTGLYHRLRGLERSPAAGWYVVPAGGAETTLPRGELRLEAVSGLETAATTQKLDLAKAAPAEVVVKLPFLFRPERHGLVAGNTHLHLRDLTLEQSDEYLRAIPPADGLKVLFISYLERHKDDASYITNRYPAGDLKQFDATGVRVGNGEEHRHNFLAFGEGYGHVMFLGIRKFVKPASLGPGITGAGDDDRPLRPGIDDARGQGGTVIWCHNTSGLEDVPSALTGRLHALNVYDGSRTGTYEDNYYRYLNVGLRLPLSTGTDWFLYDFSRVYARADGEPSTAGWLEALRAGRCVATNGPLLTLTVEGRGPGEVLKLDKAQTLRVEATGVGRHDFGSLQLVHSGRVVKEQGATGKDGGYVAKLSHQVRVEGPGWLAVRIDARAKNELDKVLYAHSSPVYVEMGGKQVFDVESAAALLRQMEEGQAAIQARGRFSSPQATQGVLALYEEAARDLTARIRKRAK